MRSRVVLASMLATLWLGAAGAAAAPLDVDTSFGTGGTLELFGGKNPGQNASGIVRAVSGPGTGYTAITSVADGAGVALNARQFATSSSPQGAARTYTAGGLHVGFDYKMVSDASGGYYAVVTVQRPLATQAGVVHVRADGSQDTAFGSGGVAYLPVRDGSMQNVFVQRRADGSLIAGDIRKEPTSQTASVTRFLSDGSVDTSFGTNGTAAPIEYATTESNVYPVALVVGADNKATLVISKGNGDIVLRRWQASGAADTGYGTAGVATVSLPGIDAYPVDAGIDSSGRVLVFSNVYPAPVRAAVSRISAAGALDGTYGVSGTVTVQPASSTSSRVSAGIVTATNEVFYTGTAEYAAAPTNRASMWWVNAAGNSTNASAAPLDVDPVSLALAGSNVVALASGTWAVRWTASNLSLAPGFSLDSLGAQVIGDDITGIFGTSDGRIVGTSNGYTDRIPFTAVGVDGAPDAGISPSAGYTAGTADLLRSVLAPDGGTFALIGLSSGKVLRLGRNGAPVSTFGTGGVVTVSPSTINYTATIIPAPGGGVFLVGRNNSNQLLVAKLTSTGGFDTSYGGGDGIYENSSFATGVEAVALADGSLVLAASGSQKIIKLTPGGTLDSGFNQYSIPVGRTLDRLFADSQGRILVVDEDNTNGAVVRRLRPSGELDTSFAGTGVMAVPTPAGLIVQPQDVAELPSGEYAMRADRSPTGGGSTLSSVLFVTEDGTPTAIHTSLGTEVAGVAPLLDGRFAIGNQFNGTTQLRLFKGAPPAAPTLTAQASGSGIEVTATADARKLTGVSVKTTVTGPGVAGAEEVKQLTASAGVQTVTRTVSGLLPNTDYVVTATVTNASGTSTATDTKVRTAALPCCARITPKASVAKITLPKKSLRSRVSAWRTLKGTATLDGGAKAGGAKLKRVQVNVVKRLKRKKGSKVARCSVFTGKRFSTMSCTKALKKWVTVKGTTKWSVRLKGLGRGTYTARVRAVDTKGRTQTTFKNGTSRVVLKLTR